MPNDQLVALIKAVDDALTLPSSYRTPSSYGTLAVAHRAWAELRATLLTESKQPELKPSDGFFEWWKHLLETSLWSPPLDDNDQQIAMAAWREGRKALLVAKALLTESEPPSSGHCDIEAKKPYPAAHYLTRVEYCYTHKHRYETMGALRTHCPAAEAAKAPVSAPEVTDETREATGTTIACGPAKIDLDYSAVEDCIGCETLHPRGQHIDELGAIVAMLVRVGDDCTVNKHRDPRSGVVSTEFGEVFWFFEQGRCRQINTLPVFAGKCDSERKMKAKPHD